MPIKLLFITPSMGNWVRFFGGAVRKAYRVHQEQVVYFTVHSEPDLEVYAENVMGHGEFDWLVWRTILGEGHGGTRPGFSLEHSLRTGTAYFAWFFEGAYQYVKKEGLCSP
jgi:hypothetical protein